MSPLVHLVADRGGGDLGFADAIQRLAMALPDAIVQHTGVARFDTIAAGFCVAELALGDGPPGRIVVHDVGPPRHQARDARYCAGLTPEGVLVIGADAGWSWSFVMDGLHGVYCLDVPAAGSRDLLPAAVRHATAHHPHALHGVKPRSSVPPVPSRAVAYADGLGNLKTTIMRLPAPVGGRVGVRIGGVSATAVVAARADAVPEGELALAPGSSGWRTRDGGRRRFLELLVGGGSAADRFGRPATGSRIAIRRRA
jgi:hypothetical protein